MCSSSWRTSQHHTCWQTGLWQGTSKTEDLIGHTGRRPTGFGLGHHVSVASTQQEVRTWVTSSGGDPGNMDTGHCLPAGLKPRDSLGSITAPSKMGPAAWSGSLGHPDWLSPARAVRQLVARQAWVARQPRPGAGEARGAAWAGWFEPLPPRGSPEWWWRVRATHSMER